MENPSKEYQILMKKIEFLNLFKQRNKAITILTKELKTEIFTLNEQSSGLIRLGLLYVSIKDDEKAAEIFDKALHLVKDQEIPFHPNFKIIFRTFNKINNSSLLAFWTDNFSKRQQFDKKYKKLF